MSTDLQPQITNRLGQLARGLTSLGIGRRQVAKEPSKRLMAPWLVVIDPQVVFAEQDSQWAVPGFGQAMDVIADIAPRFGERVIVTRWLPGRARVGSWRAYFRRWQFADRLPTDPMFDLVSAAKPLSPLASLDLPTFGKWGPAMRMLIGPTPHLVLTGFSTDCCVISTALAAADAGASVKVVSNACAASTTDGHDAALMLMNQFAPQIKVVASGQL